MRTGSVDVTQAHEEKMEHENRLDKRIVFFNLPTKYGREQSFTSARELLNVTQAHKEKVEHEKRLDKSIVFVSLPTKYGREQSFASARQED